MILINMMMAIINMAFEEIKENRETYRNKFELLDYIKRTAREVIGLGIAETVKVDYADYSDEEDEIDNNSKNLV